MNVEIVIPRPHPAQEQFINCGAKRIVVKAGRRGGKTVGVAILAVQRFLEGKRVLYAAPTQDQLGRFWSAVTRILDKAIEAKIFHKNETLHIIERIGTEQRLRAKTAWNADTLRGDYADVLILDEWQLIAEDAWDIVGAPMLLDNDGDAIFVFTPPSYRTAGVSKALDKKHASKMFDKALIETSGRWRAFHFTSYQNPHISKVALDNLIEDVSELVIRQEIMAEDINEIPGALWTLAALEKTRVTAAPELTKIYISVDPKTEETASSETGIVAVGLGIDNHGYVLGDFSLNGSPEDWATVAVSAYHELEADGIVAEINQGGDMVVSTLNMVEKNLPIIRVRATRGKYLRAEPVSVLYDLGKVHHVGMFARLEDQQRSWLPGGKSPDRLDALVQGITAIMISGRRGWARGAG